MVHGDGPAVRDHRDEPGGHLQGVAARYAHVRRRLEHTTAGHVTRRALEIDVWHQALVFAAMAFLLVVPILISVSALVPLGDGHGVAAGVARRFGLSDDATLVLQQLFPTRTTVQGSATWGGVLLSVICAFGWPLTLQKGYELAWGLPHAGLRLLWRPVAWLFTVVALLALVALLGAVPSPPGRAAFVVLGIPALVAWTWWTQHFLLCGRIAWRHVLPGAVATAAGLVGLVVLADVLLSATIVRNYEQYGPIGVVFAMMSWLIALSVVMLGGGLLGAILVERWGTDRGGTPS